MALAFFLFILGMTLLLFFSGALVRAASSLSHRLRISPLITGMTLVALGTSLPELVVSFIAASRGDIGLATGNIIGSNITNILFILAVAAIVGKIRIGTQKTLRNTLFLCLVTLIFVGSQSLLTAPWRGAVLLIFVAIFTYQQLQEGSREHALAQTKRDKKRKKPLRFDGLVCVVALAGIALGGALVVNAVENMSQFLNISTTFLGLTLTAIATSLPELLTTVMSGRNHEEKLALGNIIGSNVYNLLLIGGSLLLYHDQILNTLEAVSLLLSTAVIGLVVFTFKGKSIPTIVSALMLALYFIYLIASYVGQGSM